jgi:hypothetical protein
MPGGILEPRPGRLYRARAMAGGCIEPATNYKQETSNYFYKEKKN